MTTAQIRDPQLPLIDSYASLAQNRMIWRLYSAVKVLLFVAPNNFNSKLHRIHYQLVAVPSKNLPNRCLFVCLFVVTPFVPRDGGTS